MANSDEDSDADALLEDLGAPRTNHPTRAVILGEAEVLDRLLLGASGKDARYNSAQVIDLGYAQPDYNPPSSGSVRWGIYEVQYFRSANALDLIYFHHRSDFAAYTYLTEVLGCQVRAVRLPAVPTITYPKMFADIHDNVQLTLLRDSSGKPMYQFTSQQQWKDWVSEQVKGKGVPAAEVRRALNTWLSNETRWQLDFIPE